MIIKRMDDRSADVRQLESLLSRSDLTPDTRSKVKREIASILAGIKGEREAAYEIEFHLGASLNWAILHDLRFEHKGRVAQIDHLLVNRLLEMYVCESKRFSEGIEINERGEFAAFSNGKPYGIASPLEQNRKHILVLESILDDGLISLPKRLGFYLWPTFKSLVLVSRNARIVRPRGNVEGMDRIVKTDQVMAHISKQNDQNTRLLDAAKIISSETLSHLAAQLASLHKPMAFDWKARFGLTDSGPRVASRHEGRSTGPSMAAPESATAVCSSCGVAISPKVAEYCRTNRDRFAGNLYCWTCQRGQRQAPDVRH